MKRPRVRSTVPRTMARMACGAGIVVLIYYLLEDVRPDGAAGEVATVALFAALGGLAGAVLQRRSWPLLAGGVVGATLVAVVVVILRAVATGHLTGPGKPLVFSLLGAPIGAALVYLYGVSREVAVGTALAGGPPRRSLRRVLARLLPRYTLRRLNNPSGERVDGTLIVGTGCWDTFRREISPPRRSQDRASPNGRLMEQPQTASAKGLAP